MRVLTENGRIEKHKPVGRIESDGFVMGLSVNDILVAEADAQKLGFLDDTGVGINHL